MSVQEHKKTNTTTPAPKNQTAPPQNADVPAENSVQRVKTARELNEEDRERTDATEVHGFESKSPANLGNPHPGPISETGPVVEHTHEHDGREGTRTQTVPHQGGGTQTGQSKYELKDGKVAVQHKRSTHTPGQNGQPGTTVTNVGKVAVDSGGPTGTMGRTERTGNTSQGKFLSVNQNGGSLMNRQDTHNDDGSTNTRTRSTQVTRDSIGMSESRGKQFANGSEVSGQAGGAIIFGQETRATDAHTEDVAKGSGRMQVQRAGIKLHAGFGANTPKAFGVSVDGYFDHQVSNSVFSVDEKYAKMSDGEFKKAMAPAKDGVIGPTSLSTMDPALLEANQGYGLQTRTALGGSVGATVYGVSGNVGGGKEFEQRSTLLKKDNGKLVMDVRTAESGYFKGGADFCGVGGEMECSSGTAGQVRMEFTPNAKGEYPEFQEFQKTGVLPGAMGNKDKDYKEYAELRDKKNLSVHDNWRLSQISKRVNSEFINMGETSKQERPTVDGVKYTHLRDFNRDTTDQRATVLGGTAAQHRTEKTVERTQRVLTDSEKKDQADLDKLAKVKTPEGPEQTVMERKQGTTDGKESTLVHVDKEGDSRLLVKVDVQAREWMLKTAEELSGKKVERTDMIDRLFGDTHTIGGNVGSENIKDMIKGDTNQDPFKNASEFYRRKQKTLELTDAWSNAKDNQFNAAKRSELIKDQGPAMLAKQEWLRNNEISEQDWARRQRAENTRLEEQLKKNPHARPRITDPDIQRYMMDFQNVNRRIPGMKPGDITPLERQGLNTLNMMQTEMMFQRQNQQMPAGDTRLEGDKLFDKYHHQLADQHRELGDEAFSKIAEPKAMAHMMEQYRQGMKFSAKLQRKLSPPNLKEMSNVIDARSMYELGRTNPKAARHLIDKNSRGGNRVYMALALPAAQSNAIINSEVRSLGNRHNRTEKIADMYLDVVKTATDSPDMTRAAKARWTDLILQFNEGSW